MSGHLQRQCIIQWMEGSPIPALQASQTAHGLIHGWQKKHAEGKPGVTITLRRTRYANTVRNPDVLERAKFAQYLNEKNCVVLLDDFDHVFDSPPAGFEGCKTLPATMFSLELRSSLYQHANLNLVAGNGPIALCTTNPYSGFLAFLNMASEDSASNHTTALARAFRRAGEQGNGWFTPFQGFTWGKIEFSLIKDRFEEMSKRICSSEMLRSDEMVRTELAVDVHAEPVEREGCKVAGTDEFREAPVFETPMHSCIPVGGKRGFSKDS